jgi:hypothetical protein
MSTKRTISLDPVASEQARKSSSDRSAGGSLNKSQVLKLSLACGLLLAGAGAIWYSLRPQPPVVSQGDVVAQPPAETVEVRGPKGEKKQMEITPQMREEYNNQPVGKRWVPPPPQ